MPTDFKFYGAESDDIQKVCQVLKEAICNDPSLKNVSYRVVSTSVVSAFRVNQLANQMMTVYIGIAHVEFDTDILFVGDGK